jgi:hypothetical protein
VEFDLVATLCRPSFEDAEAKAGERADGSGLLRVFEDLCAGVVFLLHVYTLPQMRQNTRIFLRLVKLFLLMDTPPFLKRFERAFDFLWGEGSNFNLLSIYFNIYILTYLYIFLYLSSYILIAYILEEKIILINLI